MPHSYRMGHFLYYNVSDFGAGGVTEATSSGTRVNINPPIINKMIMLSTPTFVFLLVELLHPLEQDP